MQDRPYPGNRPAAYWLRCTYRFGGIDCGFLAHQHHDPGRGFTIVDHAFENNERGELVPA